MPRQCHNPKCIGSKKKLSSRRYKNKEKDSRPPSTSRRSSSDNPMSRNKRAQKPKSKRSKDNSKNLSFNKSRDYKNKKRQASQSTSESSTYSSQKLRTTKIGQVSGNSRDCKKQICTCRKEHRGAQSRNSHENSRSTDPVKRNKRRRKRSRRRHKKTSKRESNRPRRDCFVTLCACVRGCSSELRACKCTSSHGIPSHCECCCVKGVQEGKKRVTCKNTSKNDTQVGRYTASPSTSKRKSALKHSRELSAAKPNEEQSVIIRGLDTVRRGIDRFSAFVIRWMTRQQ